MIMYATVIQVQQTNLLVWDHATSQRVLVHTSNARCFCVGDQVRIKFSGIMTMSIPPQITAIWITRIRPRGHRHQCF